MNPSYLFPKNNVTTASHLPNRCLETYAKENACLRVVVKWDRFKCNSHKSLKRRPTSCKGNRKNTNIPLFTRGLSSERMYRMQTGKTSQNKSHLFSLNQCRVEDPSFN